MQRVIAQYGLVTLEGNAILLPDNNPEVGWRLARGMNIPLTREGCQALVYRVQNPPVDNGVVELYTFS